MRATKQRSQAATGPLVKCLSRIANEIILPGQAHGIPSEAICLEIWQLWLNAAQLHTDSNRHFCVAVATGGRCRDKARQLRAELGLLASACGITTTAQEAVLGTIAEAVAEAESFAHVELATKLLPVRRGEALAAFFQVQPEDPGTPPSKRARHSGDSKDTAIQLPPLNDPPAAAAAAAPQLAAAQPTPSYLATDADQEVIGVPLSKEEQDTLDEFDRWTADYGDQLVEAIGSTYLPPLDSLHGAVARQQREE